MFTKNFKIIALIFIFFYQAPLYSKTIDKSAFNSKEFLRFFEDKIEKMKNGVVSQSTFDEYKEKLNQKLFDEIQAFEKSFANKINSLEEILSKQNASWTEHLASETLNLTKNVQNEIDNAFAQTSELQTILPNKLAEVDYTVANRVSDDVANIVSWSYNHDFPWLAKLAIETLQNFDF